MRVKRSTRFSIFKEIEIWKRNNDHLLVLVQRKWHSISEDRSQGEWDRIAEQMMLTFAESTHPVFRFTSPVSRGVHKVQENCQYTIALIGNDRNLFRTVISVNQFIIYGVVVDMCEECDSCHNMRKDCIGASRTIVYFRAFHDIQDAILSIILHKTMWSFRETCFSIFTMLDVLSICILSSVRD